MTRLKSMLALAATLVTCASAADIPGLPRSVPPLVGTAVAGVRAGGAGDEWQIELTVPKVRWEVIGKDPEDKLDKRRRELKAEVEKHTLTLVLGGPSAIAPSRVVDRNGKEVSRDEVLERLKSESPVLVSVSRDMVDPYYLQLVKPDTLVIILGPRERAPAPGLLPAAKAGGVKRGISTPAIHWPNPSWGNFNESLSTMKMKCCVAGRRTMLICVKGRTKRPNINMASEAEWAHRERAVFVGDSFPDLPHGDL